MNQAWMNGRRVPEDSVRVRFGREVVERVRHNQPNPYPRPPSVAGADRLFAPRVLAPHTLTEARGQVTVSLSRPAYVALIEVGVDESWRVIYPVDSAALLPAGTSRLRTLCATTKVRGDYGPADAVPPCGVALPLTPRTVIQDSTAPAYRRYGGSSRPRLLMLAADTPLDPARVEETIRAGGFRGTPLRYDRELQNALGRLVRRSGGDRAAASEIILRR